MNYIWINLYFINTIYPRQLNIPFKFFILKFGLRGSCDKYDAMLFRKKTKPKFKTIRFAIYNLLVNNKSVVQEIRNPKYSENASTYIIKWPRNYI